MWRSFAPYLVGMIAAFVLGDAAALLSQPRPAVDDTNRLTLYPWFSSAAKMEMVNTAKENHVDPRIIEQMIRRANHWEEPFADKRGSK